MAKLIKIAEKRKECIILAFEKFCEVVKNENYTFTKIKDMELRDLDVSPNEVKNRLSLVTSGLKKLH